MSTHTPYHADTSSQAPLRFRAGGAVAWMRRPLFKQLNVPPQRAASLIRLMLDPAQMRRQFKDDPRTRVWSIDLVGGIYVFKQFTAPPGAALLHRLYHMLRCSPAWREWRGAATLERLGVRVCRPLALIHAGSIDALIMPHIDGANLHDHLLHETDATRRRSLAVLIGQQIGRITSQGRINRDHKARNLMIDAKSAASQSTPILIDPAGLRRRTPLRVEQMFALLLETVPTNVTRREALRCLHAAYAHDPTLASSLRQLVGRIDRAYRAKTGAARFA